VTTQPQRPPTTVTIRLLFDYLYWARDRVLDTAGSLGEGFAATPVVGTRDLRATLAHEIDVEMSWRARLRGEPESAWGAEAEIRPEHIPTVAAVRERWAAEEEAMRAWLEGLSDADLAAPVTANGLEGYALAIYLVHVAEHGVMEIAGAAASLAATGRSTGDLGVLDALDDLAPLPRPGATDA
jgi:uncharacterized damage-inducible protein DinB